MGFKNIREHLKYQSELQFEKIDVKIDYVGSFVMYDLQKESKLME